MRNSAKSMDMRELGICDSCISLPSIPTVAICHNPLDHHFSTTLSQTPRCIGIRTWSDKHFDVFIPVIMKGIIWILWRKYDRYYEGSVVVIMIKISLVVIMVEICIIMNRIWWLLWREYGRQYGGSMVFIMKRIW